MSYISWNAPFPLTISSNLNESIVEKQLYAGKVPSFPTFCHHKRQYFEVLVLEIKCQYSTADLCAQIYANMLNNLYKTKSTVSGRRARWARRNCHASNIKLSLRSKRVGKAFGTFDALFGFLAAGKLGRAQKSAFSPPLPTASIIVALAPIFAQPKSEKRLQRAESPTETLATQAVALATCDWATRARTLMIPLIPFAVWRHVKTSWGSPSTPWRLPWTKTRPARTSFRLVSDLTILNWIYPQTCWSRSDWHWIELQVTSSTVSAVPVTSLVCMIFTGSEIWPNHRTA